MFYLDNSSRLCVTLLTSSTKGLDNVEGLHTALRQILSSSEKHEVALAYPCQPKNMSSNMSVVPKATAYKRYLTSIWHTRWLHAAFVSLLWHLSVSAASDGWYSKFNHAVLAPR